MEAFLCFRKVPSLTAKREAVRQAEQRSQQGLVCCLTGAGTAPSWLAAGRQLVYLAQGAHGGFLWHLYILLAWLFLTKSLHSTV